MEFVCYNGNMVDATAPVLLADNRGFKYGDGLFETMRFRNGQVLLESYHYERLFAGLKLLKIDYLPGLQDVIAQNIFELCKQNNCMNSARVRLAVFRNGNNRGEYLIEAQLLQEDFYQLNNEGWIIDVYPFAQKSCDAFATLKNANHLPYVLAGLYAKENGMDECLVLNNASGIADGSRTNIFLIKGNAVITPALDQGCVNGVMRRHIINELKKLNFIVKEKKVLIEDLINAGEVFLTNAIQGIKWVQNFREKEFGNAVTQTVFNTIFNNQTHKLDFKFSQNVDSQNCSILSRNDT